MISILLVEDDQNIVNNLSAFLRTEGFSVYAVPGQESAMKAIQTKHFYLVLLDISLSDGNGFSLCSAIKSESDLPVIFLTASSDEYSTVTGFELGADDYIAKPFRPRELVSRIRNILRLTSGAGAVMQLGDVQVDTVRGTVTRNGTDLCLSALEYRLLLVFLNNRGAVLSRAMLLESIWDIAGEFVNDNTLTVYIKRLRDKLEDDPQDPQLIRTVRGLGYRVD